MRNPCKTRLALGWTTTAVLMLAVVVAGGCASTPETPSVRNQVIPDGHAEGAALYHRYCASCHDLYDPTRFTDFQWSSIMRDMAREANLDKRRAAKIEAFVKSAND